MATSYNMQPWAGNVTWVTDHSTPLNATVLWPIKAISAADWLQKAKSAFAKCETYGAVTYATPAINLTVVV